MQGQSMIGVVAAIFAAFSWSLNFVAPYVLGPYSIYDLAVCRFLISGLMGLGVLFLLRNSPPRLALVDWFVAAWLGFIGYIGYFLTIMGAVLFAGPIVPPAFVALVPVVLAVAGNLGRTPIPWRSLSVPLSLTTIGLLLVNARSLLQTIDGFSRQVGIGIAFSVGAVLLWTLFALSNRASLQKRPAMDARKWTAAMMIGGAIEIAAFIPPGLSFGLFKTTQIGLHWSQFAPVFWSSMALAAIGSIAGSWAWTIASKRLPIGLAGQLIVTETIFATTFGLVANHRWPTWNEATGVSLLVVGVVAAIGVFHGQHRTTSSLGDGRVSQPAESAQP